MNKVNEFTHPSYRRDIDGLRALAVAAVVLFHAFPNALKGGFIGVDVFFVISGYLISTIIFMNLDKGTFSFFEFYARRIKRIFPALLLMLVAVYIFGWFTLLEDEYRQLGKHITAGAAFLSNYIFWKEVNYFDNSAETKPLLHLWSLGIEEQFYIVWPLILWFAWKKGFNLLTIALACALISFFLNIKGVKNDLAATFYSPQTRFWELLCGSILAWLSLYKKSYFVALYERLNDFCSAILYKDKKSADETVLLNIISCFGVLLVFYGLYVIDKSHAFPGKWAIFPVLGTVLVILAGPKAWFNRVVFSNKIAVWIGLISFPLYLWHWPLLSYARIIAGGTPSISVRIGAVVLAVVLAWLTYRFIEIPIRKNPHEKAKVFIFSAIMLIIGGVGYYTYKQAGLNFRAVSEQNIYLHSGEDGGAGVTLADDCGIADAKVKKLFTVCASDKRDVIRYALMGDSKGHALFPGLIRTSAENKRWLFIGGHGANGSPVPLLGPDGSSNNNLTLEAIKAISNNKAIETVVIASSVRAILGISDNKGVGNAYSYDYEYMQKANSVGNYDEVVDKFDRVVQQFVAAEKIVVLVVDNPALPEPKDCIFRQTSLNIVNHLQKKNEHCNIAIDKFKEETRLYREMLNNIKLKNPGKVQIFDPTNIYCDEKEGLCGPTKNNRIMYSYTDHISDYAAGLVGRELNLLLTGKQ